jgi:hypothetical protein
MHEYDNTGTTVKIHPSHLYRFRLTWFELFEIESLPRTASRLKPWPKIQLHINEPAFAFSAHLKNQSTEPQRPQCALLLRKRPRARG